MILKKDLNEGWDLAIIDYVYGKPGKKYLNVIGFVKCIHKDNDDDYKYNYYEAMVPELDYQVCYIHQTKIVEIFKSNK